MLKFVDQCYRSIDDVIMVWETSINMTSHFLDSSGKSVHKVPLREKQKGQGQLLEVCWITTS